MNIPVKWLGKELVTVIHEHCLGYIRKEDEGFSVWKGSTCVGEAKDFDVAKKILLDYWGIFGD